MKKIEETTIKLTRGDSFDFGIELELEDGTPRNFEIGDRVIFTIKDNFGEEEPILRKEVIIDEADTNVAVFSLDKNDTSIGDLISEKATYQYDICINDDETILGYDDDGPKLIIIYPEGSNDE